KVADTDTPVGTICISMYTHIRRHPNAVTHLTNPCAWMSSISFHAVGMSGCASRGA
ncbi:unnamed protein product, partial [Mycena citricolor]